MNYKGWLAIIGFLIISAILGIAAIYTLINYTPQFIPSFLIDLSRQPDLLKISEAKTCGECHSDIFEDWKKSRHSVSWTSDGYIKDSKDRTKEKCLPCHIPNQVSAGEKPNPRSSHRDQGVFCIPCHVKEDGMHGPYELLSPPHPTKRNEVYRSSKFCGSCHEKTYKEWKSVESKETCQSCHMKTKRARLTQKFPMGLFHARRQVANHAFPKGDLDEDNLYLEAVFKEESLIITLTNRTIPHLVPTADNGDPRLYLYVLFLNTEGNEIDNFKEILAPQQDSALPYKQPAKFQYLSNNKTDKAIVTLKYKAAWSKERKTIQSIILPK